MLAWDFPDLSCGSGVVASGWMRRRVVFRTLLALTTAVAGLALAGCGSGSPTRSGMMGGTAPLGAYMMLRAAPATIPAGEISIVASNLGWRTHELVILPQAAGALAGQREPGSDGKVPETGSLAEASHSCSSGTGEGITSGTVSWTTVTLRPGHYELICNQSNHYADGMYQELVVT
jgi:uncharacterized cupredoxin-like copper-binding protein